jgi:hypothetical protein
MHGGRAHAGVDALGDVLETYGVTEANWRDVLDRPFEPPYPDPRHFGISETPRYAVEPSSRSRRTGRRSLESGIGVVGATCS